MTRTTTRLVAALVIGAGVLVAGGVAEARSGIGRGHPAADSGIDFPNGDSNSGTGEQSAGPSKAVRDDRGEESYPDRSQDGSAPKWIVGQPQACVYGLAHPGCSGS